MGAWLRARRKRPRAWQSRTRAALIELFNLLNETSDVFPPLKSAVGGVLHLWRLSERVKSVRTDAIELAERAVKILQLLSDALLDVTDIPHDLHPAIHEFDSTLRDIVSFIEDLQVRSKFSRFLDHKKHKSQLSAFNRRLDNSTIIFQTGSCLRMEKSNTRIESSLQQIDVRVTEHFNITHSSDELIKKKLHELDGRIVLLSVITTVLFD